MLLSILIMTSSGWGGKERWVESTRSLCDPKMTKRCLMFTSMYEIWFAWWFFTHYHQYPKHLGNPLCWWLVAYNAQSEGSLCSKNRREQTGYGKVDSNEGRRVACIDKGFYIIHLSVADFAPLLKTTPLLTISRFMKLTWSPVLCRWLHIFFVEWYGTFTLYKPVVTLWYRFLPSASWVDVGVIYLD